MIREASVKTWQLRRKQVIQSVSCDSLEQVRNEEEDLILYREALRSGISGMCLVHQNECNQTFRPRSKPETVSNGKAEPEMVS